MILFGVYELSMLRSLIVSKTAACQIDLMNQKVILFGTIKMTTWALLLMMMMMRITMMKAMENKMLHVHNLCFWGASFYVTKSHWDNSEVPQQVLTLHQFHVAGHQVFGTVNVMELEITEKCCVIWNTFFYHLLCLLMSDDYLLFNTWKFLKLCILVLRNWGVV
jgi:hypothetical protein